MDYKKIQAFFFLTVLVLALALTIAVFWPYLYAVVFALTLAVVFNPLYKKIAKYFKKHKGIPSLLIVLLVFLIILVPLVFIGVLMAGETKSLLSSINSESSYVLLEKTQHFINASIPGVNIDLISSFNTYAGKILNFIIVNIGPIFSNLVGILLGFLLTLFALYYLLKDGVKFKKTIITFSPLADRYDKQILKKLMAAVNSVMKGSLLIAIIQGFLVGIGFWIFSVPNPVLWGTVAVIASLIPAVGTTIVVLPAVLFLFFKDQMLGAVGLLLWGSILVGLIDNFLRPKLIEKDIKLHPFLIFLSVLGGISLFGAFGFLIGPLVLSLLFALLDIYKEEFHDYLK